MKKKSLSVTIMSFVLIFAILAFGVYVLISLNKTITSSFNIELKDTNIKIPSFVIDTGSNWLGKNGAPQEYSVETETDADGFVKSSITDLPTLYMDPSCKDNPPVLSFKFQNEGELGLKLTLSGLPSERIIMSDGSILSRFVMEVSWYFDGTLQPEPVTVTPKNQSIEIICDKDVENVEIKITYKLNMECSSFDIGQNIKIAVESIIEEEPQND